MYVEHAHFCIVTAHGDEILLVYFGVFFFCKLLCVENTANDIPCPEECTMVIRPKEKGRWGLVHAKKAGEVCKPLAHWWEQEPQGLS